MPTLCPECACEIYTQFGSIYLGGTEIQIVVSEECSCPQGVRF